jgi:anti-sigma B factor antagonist
MPLPAYYHWLEVEQVGDVTVVRFAVRSILDGPGIEAMGEQLFDLVESAGCRRFVISFANVESVATAMLGKFIVLHRKLEAVRGRVVLCRVGDFLGEIFKLLEFPRLFRIYGNEQEALQSF